MTRSVVDVAVPEMKTKPATDENTNSLPVSEMFYSLQGEGPSIGRPAIFIRLWGCNLRCKWCDTPFAYHTKDGDNDYTDMKIYQMVEEIRELANLRPLVVITGGEPLMHNNSLVTLVRALRKHGYRYIEIETNGTLLPPDELKNVCIFIVSPKLTNARLKNAPDIHYSFFVGLAKEDRARFKFVVDKKEDMREIWEIEGQYHMQPEWTYLMPQGRNTRDMQTREWLVDICKQIGYRYSPRLQVLLWGDKRGV